MEDLKKNSSQQTNDWYLLLILLVVLILNILIFVELRAFKREVTSFASWNISVPSVPAKDTSKEILKDVESVEIKDLEQEFQQIDQELNNL